MSQETIPTKGRLEDNLMPAEPVPAEAHDFTKRMRGLMDGKPKDEATVAQAFEGMDEMLDRIAAGLYNLASMLVGEGEDSVRLVETAVANAEVSACHDPALARQSSRRALCAAALDILEQRQPGCLAPPPGLTPATTCIEDDDLDSMGESGKELLRMLAGPDRDRVRSWLTSMRTVPRTIFVLRAVAGFTAADAATLLAAHGGPEAAGWTTDAVSEFCRQGLCSLASQLIQASAKSR
jgi:DNA-directed RNA polymerase specialized sigma24 family protein